MNAPGYMREFGGCSRTTAVTSRSTLRRASGTWMVPPRRSNGQHRTSLRRTSFPATTRWVSKVLIDHETFHVYHHQMTGVLGALEEAIPTIEVALWSEGLATLVSWRMNPGVSLYCAPATGHSGGRAAASFQDSGGVARSPEERNELTFSRNFQSGKQPEGYPPRSGILHRSFDRPESVESCQTLRQLSRLEGALATDTRRSFTSCSGSRSRPAPLPPYAKLPERQAARRSYLSSAALISNCRARLGNSTSSSCRRRGVHHVDLVPASTGVGVTVGAASTRFRECTNPWCPATLS